MWQEVKIIPMEESICSINFSTILPVINVGDIYEISLLE